MSLPEICIRRPVFASVLSLLLILVGIISYVRLPVREYPAIDQPVVSVVTDYPGASPEIMETQVTQVLEASIAGIAGIDVLSSASRQESSRITARFTLETDPEDAAADVRDRVSRVRGRLPDEIDEPVIRKVRPMPTPSSISLSPAIACRHWISPISSTATRATAPKPARRGRGPDPGRAALCDADLARSRPAGRLRP